MMDKTQKFSFVIWSYGVFIGMTASTMGSELSLGMNLLVGSLLTFALVASLISIKNYKEVIRGL